MDRRATLSTLLGRPKQADQEKPMTVNMSLDPYAGPWAFEQAAHLLRRTIFGPTYSQIKDAVQNGLEATVNSLLADQPLPDPPVNYYFQNDPNVPVGETWIGQPYDDQNQFAVYRTRSLAAWTFGLINQQGLSIREKMVLFWHNHFVVSNVNDPKFVYRYITTIRERALGNFRELVKEINVDPAMLRYLNGNQNTAVAPNENYARELLELFTIGKGPLAGPGDYTHYTEDDIKEMARILTGWVGVGYFSNDDTPVNSIFIPNWHDQGTKQLSHRFDNVVISNAGDQEHQILVDIIFQKSEVARFICRKLYRWFVYYDINDTIEQNVIEPLAQIFIDNDYEIKPALEALLKSQHFFDMLSMGCIIKNPIDFVMGLVNQLEVPVPDNLTPQYFSWLSLFQVTPEMQMQYYAPPDVAGWKAYYQEPSYYRLWINSVTLPQRMSFTDTMATTGLELNPQFSLQIDVLNFILTIDNNLDPNAVVSEFASILFPQPLTQIQLDYLKNALIPGLPDYEWTIEFGDYLVDPTNMDLATSIENKLRNLFKAMLAMPEYHLS